MFHKSLFLIMTVSTLTGTPLAAHADAYADLSQARVAFAAVHSWHGVEQMSNGRTVIVDHVAPDRWRIQPMPNMTEILIGNDLYLIRDGKTMHMPFVMPQIQQMVNQNWLAEDAEIKRSARDLGTQSVDGTRLHGYSFTAKGVPVTMYLDSRHLPVRSIVTTAHGTVTTIYSQYNAAITITP